MSDRAREGRINLSEEPQVELEIPCEGTLRVEYVERPVLTAKTSSTTSGLPPEVQSALARLQAMQRPNLRKWMHKRFSPEELQIAIFDLEIDSSAFKMDTKAATIREMIGFCERHGRLPELLEYLAEQRTKTLLDT